MDLVSQSVEKLQPLPSGPAEENKGPQEAQWLQNLLEYSERGSKEAQFSMGQYYLRQGQLPVAVQYLMKAEQANSGQARYQLAVMYYDGLGMEADAKKGFQLMMQVAQSRDPRDRHLLASAQFNIARAYFQGYGTAQSDEEAIRWWTQAASAGSEPSAVRAMNTLAMVFSRPETCDMHKAFYWHSQAATNGHLESMAALGLLHLRGEGCQKDREIALRWMKRSSESGCVYGTGVLAHHYYCSKLFTKAVETAHRISELDEDVGFLAEQSDGLQILVSKGIALACFVLARCLQLGQAVSRNEGLAYTYFEKAKQYDKATVAELHTQMMYGRM